jgi:ATP-binding cassette subfamily B protein
MTYPASRSLPSIVGGGFRLLARYVRAHPLAYAVGATGAALFAAAIVTSAVVVGRITDSLILPVLERGEPIQGRLWPAVAAVLGVAVWKAAGITLRRTGAGWLQARTQADLRTRLIEHQLELEMGWFAEQATGDLLSVSDTDASQATHVLGPLPYATGASLLLVGTMVMIALLDPWLGAATAAGLVVIMATDLGTIWRIFRVFEEVQLRRGKVAAVAHEAFDGALTIKALGREDFVTERFRDVSDDLRDELIRLGRVAGNFRPIVESLPAVITVGLVLLGAVRIRDGAITPGDLVTVAYLFSLLTIPVRLIAYMLWDLTESLAGWERVAAVLAVDRRVAYGDLAAQADGSGATVEGEAVRFAYFPELPVLDGVQLDVPAGRTVAVVGPTASGKSTLARLLARLWDPGSGRILLDGRDLRRFGPGALPAEVAYVAQEAFLFDDTVRGNITLGRDFTDPEVEEAARLARAEDFIAALPGGYATRIGERGVTLSGGQRQRLALARALVRRPRLLVLDDATSAVDPSVEAEILRGLKSARLPSTVILVAHRPASIVLADEVVFIDHGRVAGQGRHEDLLAGVPGYVRLLRAYEEDAADRREAS